MTSDTLTPRRSIYVLQQERKHSAYYRKRHRRGLILYRQGTAVFVLCKDWLGKTLLYASIGRRTAAGRERYFLLVPPETRENDGISILEGGGSIGHILKKDPDGVHRKYIGAAYVHRFFGVRMPSESWDLERVSLR